MKITRNITWKTIISTGLLLLSVSYSVSSHAGPDGPSLCTHGIILSPYFTPHFRGDTRVIDITDYSNHYCYMHLDYLYHSHTKSYLPLTAPEQYRETLDINAVSILKIERTSMASDHLAVSLDAQHLTQLLAAGIDVDPSAIEALYLPDNIDDLVYESALKEVINLLNLILEEEQKRERVDPAAKLQVTTNETQLKALGFTNSMLTKLHGQWIFE